MSEYTPACIAAEEIVARETAQAALDEMNEAIEGYDAGLFNTMELLGQLACAGSLATRSMMRGWPFLYERKTP